MTWDSEHKIYSILATIQCAIVILGTIVLGFWLRAFGYGRPEVDIGVRFHPLSVFFRNWGLLFLLVPIAWVLGSIAFERRHPAIEYSGYRVVSGLILVGALVVAFVLLVGSGVRFGLLQMSNQ